VADAKNGARMIRTPFLIADRLPGRQTAGPPQQEKWFGRGSRLSPVRPSDAPISRTDQTASYDLLNRWSASSPCYQRLHVTVTWQCRSIFRRVCGLQATKKPDQ